MSNQFEWRVIDAAVLEKVYLKPRTIPTSLGGILKDDDLAALYRGRSVGQVANILVAVLNDHIARTFLNVIGKRALTITETLVEVYLHPSSPTRGIDLQLSLVVNLIADAVKVRRQAGALTVDGQADDILRSLAIDSSDFKLAVRKLLFDQREIDRPIGAVVVYEKNSLLQL